MGGGRIKDQIANSPKTLKRSEEEMIEKTERFPSVFHFDLPLYSRKRMADTANSTAAPQES